MSEAAPAAEALGRRTVEAIPLWDYVKGFYVPNMRPQLALKPEHKDICDAFELAVSGELGYQFVAVNMPPRTGKTTIGDATGTWTEGGFDGSQIIQSAYAQDQVALSLLQMETAMTSQWYIDLYGQVLHGISQKSDHLSTMAGGNIFAEGVGGQLLGKGGGGKGPGGGYIMIDDPTKPQQTLSLTQTVAKSIHNWFEVTLLNRRNSDKWCPILIICQRLGLSDLVEYLKTNYRNETLILKYPCFVNRKSRFPETYSDDRIDKADRTRLGRFVFASQLQQEPISLGGNMIPVDKFMRYSPSDRKLPWEDKIVVSDTALKKGQGNDWWVLQCWGRLGRRAYLIDQRKYQCNSAEFIRYASEFYHKHMTEQPERPVSQFIIEDAAAGPGVISALNEAGIPATPVIPVKDKAARVNDILPFVEVGLVYLPPDNDDPESAEWLPGLLVELSSFSQDMTHEHDDQTDALVYAVNALLSSGLSILQVLGIEPAQFGQ